MFVCLRLEFLVARSGCVSHLSRWLLLVVVVWCVWASDVLWCPCCSLCSVFFVPCLWLSIVALLCGWHLLSTFVVLFLLLCSLMRSCPSKLVVACRLMPVVLLVSALEALLGDVFFCWYCLSCYVGPCPPSSQTLLLLYILSWRVANRRFLLSLSSLRCACLDLHVVACT